MMPFAIKEMKEGKASGQDDMVIEMIKHMGEIGKHKLLKLLNKIYKKIFISASSTTRKHLT